MRLVLTALFGLGVLGVPGVLVTGCGDDTHHRNTTTDETFTSSVGDEDEEDEEAAEPEPEGAEPGE